MKKTLAKVIFFFNKRYFTEMSYAKLEEWGITDIVNGKLYFE